jgi:hypothetical protein
MFDSNETLASKRDVDVRSGGMPAYFRLIAQQYRKTFVTMQVVIGIITATVLIQTHRLIAAFAFFVVMQLGAVFGAMWAARLRSLVETSP